MGFCLSRGGNSGTELAHNCKHCAVQIPETEADITGLCEGTYHFNLKAIRKQLDGLENMYTEVCFFALLVFELLSFFYLFLFL